MNPEINSSLDTLIGKRLRAARKARGFKSARSFARYYHIPPTTYAQHEIGKRSLNPRTLIAYCEYLHTTPDWLMGKEPVRYVDSHDLNLTLLQAILKKHLFGLLQNNAQLHFDKIIEFCMTSYVRALKELEHA